MRNMYDPVDIEDIKARLARMQPDQPPLWGSMTAPQAVAHCARSLEWPVGDRVPPRMFWAGFIGRAIKSKVLGNDAPFRRNSPTSPDLIIKDDRDLNAERTRLLGLIDRFAAQGPDRCTRHPHSFFGPLTAEQWAILTYKHLDHHLRQFGV